ncbi:Ig-like domain-containing protein [Micromonospora sp. WMMD998]|uniref:Ig-like domain-containing protein n=1 Tax=Micromonospora sp. WMMD998 TaxID=3016092 RepID=UPI00249B0750|nr:Ig-like domain-containing protein [Micromonospora sp. WMMD998]WFE41030.1 cellulose binding domain-containing protein [Micromonospora sp. WMMD998]
MRHRILALATAAAVVVGGAITMVLPPAYAAATCTVDYTITREWSTGFWAELTVTNLGAPVTDWWLRFRAANNQMITMGLDRLPDGYTLGSGEMYPLTTLRPPAGSTLPTGGSVTVRFGGNYRGTDPVPTDWLLSGQPCDGDVGGPAPSSPPASGSAQPSPSPTPSPLPGGPSVALTSPLPNDFFAAPGVIPIRAEATAATAGRRIERVEFRERGRLLAVDTTAPYAFDWRGVPPNTGTRITATAYDSSGAQATAEVRGVRVLPPPAPGAAPALKAFGNRIRTVTPDPRSYRPRGVVRSDVSDGCAWGPIRWDGPVDEASVAALRARGVNAVRVVLTDACYAYPGTSRQDRVGYLDEAARYVDRLARAGITPVVSLRQSDTSAARTFWSAVAEVFGDDNAVVLDISPDTFPAAGGADPAVVWTCWRDGGPACAGTGLPPFGVQEQIRLLRVQGSFNLVLAAGIDGGNDLSRWREYRPADPDGRSVAAAWRVDDRSACATPACWQSTLLPVAAQVPLVATDVSAGPAAPTFVRRTVTWLDQHGIGHLRR